MAHGCSTLFALATQGSCHALQRLRNAALAAQRRERLGLDRGRDASATRGYPMGYLGWGTTASRRSKCSPMPPRRAASRCSASARSRSMARSHAVTEAIVRQQAVRRPAPLHARRPARRRAQPADRRADERALRHAAARHGRTDGRSAAWSTSPTGPTRSMVPQAEGRFDLDEYIDYLIEFPRTHRPGART